MVPAPQAGVPCHRHAEVDTAERATAEVALPGVRDRVGAERVVDRRCGVRGAGSQHPAHGHGARPQRRRAQHHPTAHPGHGYAAPATVGFWSCCMPAPSATTHTPHPCTHPRKARLPAGGRERRRSSVVLTCGWMNVSSSWAPAHTEAYPILIRAHARPAGPACPHVAGVGVAQLVEQGQCQPPGVGGGPLVARRVVAVAEMGQGNRLVVGVGRVVAAPPALPVVTVARFRWSPWL